MAQEGLGRAFDISVGLAPVDLSVGANTGKRVSLRNAAGVTIVFRKGAGGAGEDPVLTLQQHTAASGGSSANLASIDHYYYKSATTMAGTETWTRAAQSASQTVTLTGEAQKQGIYVFFVNGQSLADGYKYVSLSIADVGSTAQLGSVEYFLGDLTQQRTPGNLPAGLS
ncbi:hypothetical protein [Streptomyces sp. NPDC091383]|uniref:hypothetical protein n=1 Tax=Streptomyces sp. NPDC091383 TaxID=3365996 RepID=UPI003827D70C